MLTNSSPRTLLLAASAATSSAKVMEYSRSAPGFSGDDFLKLLHVDLLESDCESADDSGSIASEGTDLVQYAEPFWVDEPHSDDDALQEEDGSEDVRTLRSKDGAIAWLSKPVKSESPPFVGQTGGYPNSVVNPQSIKESFELFFNIGMKNLILTHTNENGVSQYKDKWKIVDSRELDAVVGLLILAGVFKCKGQETRELWEESTGIPRFRATISYNRFQDILRCMKFDDSKTRDQRKKLDPLAPVSEYLEIFSHCCRSNYIPSMEISVGQQLYPWRGRSDYVKVYLPSKPGKFGLRFWTAADAANSYCISTKLHCLRIKQENYGVAQEGTKVDQTKDVVDSLCSHLYGQGRRFTIDGLLVNYDLALNLLKEETYILGTVCKDNNEVPDEMLLEKKRKIGSCLFGFTNEVTICSHIPKRHSSLLLMSTAHKDSTLSIVKDYLRTRDAVDNLDKLLGMYSAKRKTKRWPMVVFYNTLDLACYNAFIIWLFLKPNWSTSKHQRRSFLKQLAVELTDPQIQLRASTQSLHRSTKRAIEDSGFTVLKQIVADDPLGTCKRKRCHICPRSIDRKSQVTCHECNLPVCKEHSNTTVVCRTCLQSDDGPAEVFD